MEAVHGVTIEEVHIALQRNDWNPVRAEQQLKVRPLKMTHHKCEEKHFVCLYMGI